MANTKDKKFRYREVSFETSVNFSSNISSGYKLNGNVATTPSDSELTVHKLFTRMGKQGWELMHVLDNQYYLFKKYIQPK
jgi:hypothetical protein